MAAIRPIGLPMAPLHRCVDVLFGKDTGIEKSGTKDNITFKRTSVVLRAYGGTANRWVLIPIGLESTGSRDSEDPDVLRTVMASDSAERTGMWFVGDPYVGHRIQRGRVRGTENIM